jgi:hypothetical protein
MQTNGTAPRALAVVQRKYEVRASEPGPHTQPRVSALAKAAEALSRRNMLSARCELANEALSALVALCYERDAGGELCNVDPHTLRVLVPMPWGRAGHKRWGMRASEAVCMRWIMLKRVDAWTASQRPLLLDYDSGSRSWLLNLKDYSTPEAAAFWLGKSRIKLGEWRAAAAAWQAGREDVLRDGKK